jgi:hypothetical protein
MAGGDSAEPRKAAIGKSSSPFDSVEPYFEYAFKVIGMSLEALFEMSGFLLSTTFKLAILVGLGFLLWFGWKHFLH